MSTGTCSRPFVINNFNPTINVRWYFKQLYLPTTTLTLIWRVIFITEAPNWLFWKPVLFGFRTKEKDCWFPLTLPGQLILLAFLVEFFFIKTAMSLFSKWIRNFYLYIVCRCRCVGSILDNIVLFWGSKGEIIEFSKKGTWEGGELSFCECTHNSSSYIQFKYF